MIFIKDSEAYATVWKVNPSENGKYIDLQVSTSEKDKEGEYINSSWFPRCIGHAVNSLKGLEERDRIKIKSFKITNEYNREKNQSYFRFLILDAERLDSGGNKGTASAKSATTKPAKKAAPKVNDTEEDLPW